MLRPVFAAMLGSAFGAMNVAAVRERLADQLVQPVEAWSVLAVALLAGAIAVIILPLREPRRCGHQPSCCGARRPAPPTGGSGVTPPRDAAGRFTAR
ncbi:hypothetical protein [Methylobacterium organophilum]|uniref:Uncharacterized protein n=1 Tax=Methylobacterium organophilum TaxID=410 RepID=A0ABQ4TCA9_METOR|nr:hypothetical protein [Methylobacterium organophilum]GJE27962.1 hypothetical protein LKMONMHP_2824 [Methylobacterium organophilum]